MRLLCPACCRLAYTIDHILPHATHSAAYTVLHTLLFFSNIWKYLCVSSSLAGYISLAMLSCQSVNQYVFCVFQQASKAICICGVVCFCRVPWSVCTTCRASSWSSCSVRWVTLWWSKASLQQKSDSACLLDEVLCVWLEAFRRPMLRDLLPGWKAHQLLR